MRTSGWDRERFKQTLEAIRAGAEMTAAELSAFATTTGMSRSQFNRWTNGSNQPTYDALARFVRTVQARFPHLAEVASDLMVAAGYGVMDSPSEVLGDPALVVASLRAAAAAQAKTLGQFLVENGISAEELAAPEEPPQDPIIAEIEADEYLRPEKKAKLIRIYLEKRAEIFEAERQRRQREQRRPSA